MNKPLVPGSFAAWGRTFFSKYDFLNKPLVPGSFAAWGGTFSHNIAFFNKPLVPGNFAAWGRTFSQNMTLFSTKPHVLALNTAHVLRLNKAGALALNKAHVSRLNTKICPVFTANTKETTKGGRPKADPPLWRRPMAASFVLAVNIGHILVLRRRTCVLSRVES